VRRGWQELNPCHPSQNVTPLSPKPTKLRGWLNVYSFCDLLAGHPTQEACLYYSVVMNLLKLASLYVYVTVELKGEGKIMHLLLFWFLDLKFSIAWYPQPLCGGSSKTFRLCKNNFRYISFFFCFTVLGRASSALKTQGESRAMMPCSGKCGYYLDFIKACGLDRWNKPVILESIPHLLRSSYFLIRIPAVERDKPNKI
jgi:hypothetical protein